MLFHQTVGDIRDDIRTAAKFGFGPPLRRSPCGRCLLQQTPARLGHRNPPCSTTRAILDLLDPARCEHRLHVARKRRAILAMKPADLGSARRADLGNYQCSANCGERMPNGRSASS